MIKSKLNLFEDWELDTFTFTSPDGKYCFWICNGLSYFKDHKRVGNNSEPFINLLNYWQKKKIWELFK